MNSPLEVSSRSVSPVVLRPSGTPTTHVKQRSSSMNLVGSSQSAYHRSMSMVSLDDFGLKLSRENSSSSLVSLGIIGSRSPLMELVREPYTATNRLPRSKPRGGCALFSDEESSGSEQMQILTRTAAWRRRSSDKLHKSEFLMSFKNSFKFKCDGHIKHKVPGRAAEETIPSLLSSAVESITHDLKNASAFPALLDLESFPLSSLPPPARPADAPTVKKVRSSSMTQLIFLKRKMLLSKDIQLELYTDYASAGGAFETNISHMQEMHAHGYLSAQPTPHLPSASSLFTAYHPASSSAVLPSTELTLRQQNKLISELNRKWNRAMYPSLLDDCTHTEGASLDLAAGRRRLSRKRGRSELVSSTDSVATDY